jgi:hypothetical protein
MITNKKYTALEILKALDLKTFKVGEAEFTPEQVFGKVRVMIGGIMGIVKPEHAIRVVSTGKLEIVVGNEKYELPLEEERIEEVVE